MTSLVTDLLCKYLAKYLDGVTSETLRVGIWAGVVELNDLRIKKEILDNLALPISIKLGYVGKLRLEVPWKSLWSSPVKLILEQVLLVTGPAHKDSFDADKENQRLKRAKASTILGAELYQKALEEALDEETLPFPASAATSQTLAAPETRVESIISSILRNAIIEVNRVHVRYEDAQSASSRTIAFGLTLNSLSLTTNADENNYNTMFENLVQSLAQRIEKTVDKLNEANIDTSELESNFTKLFPTSLSAIFKTISVSDLAIYYNSRDSLFLPEKTTIDSLIFQDSMPAPSMSTPISITLPTDDKAKQSSDASSNPLLNQPSVPEFSVERIIRRMLSMISRPTLKPGTEPKPWEPSTLQYLLEPVSIEVSIKTHARISKNPIFSEPNLQFIVKVKSPDGAHRPASGSPGLRPSLGAISICMDQDQLASFGSVSRTLSALAVKRRFAQFKPSVSAIENPRAWWLFLRQSLFSDIQQRKYRQTLAFIDRRRSLRIKYVSVYREKMLKEWGYTTDPIATNSNQNLSTATVTYLNYQLDSIEGQLEASDIIFFRAFARMQLESEGIVKPSSDSSKKSTSLFSKVLSWSGMGGGPQVDAENLHPPTSSLHISRLEDDGHLTHSLPWVHKLRLSIDSSDPTSSWVASHSDFARSINPKFRNVHPDYVAISGSVSIPSIQVNLMELLVPQAPPLDDHDGLTVKPPVLFASRIPLGRLEIQGIQVGVEVKPTHKTTSLRVGVGSLSMVDLTKPSEPAFVVQYRREAENINLIDLILEINPYSRDDGALLPYDMAIEAKVRRLEVFARLPFLMQLGHVYASPANRSYENILEASQTLDRLKKVTRRATASQPTASGGSTSKSLLLDANVELPMIIVQPLVTSNVETNGDSTKSASSSRASSPSSVIVVDLGTLEVKSAITFPDLPTVASHSALIVDSEMISAATESSDVPLSNTVKNEKAKTANEMLSGETDGRKARKILRSIYGHFPLHICARWINTLFISWSNLSVTVSDCHQGEEAQAMENVQLHLSSLTRDHLMRINAMYSNFNYAHIKSTAYTTRYLLIPTLPSRIAVKLSSNPLMFVREASIALKEASRSHTEPTKPESSIKSQMEQLSKVSVFVSLARISLQVDPNSVSSILNILPSILPKKSESPQAPIPLNASQQRLPDFEDPLALTEHDYAHQLVPSRKDILFARPSTDLDDSASLSSESSSSSVPTISVEPASSSAEPVESDKKHEPIIKKKLKSAGSQVGKWVASNLTLKLLFRGLGINIFLSKPSPDCRLAIALLDARVSMVSQPDAKSEIRASVGSLLVHAPSSAGSFSFASSIPLGHFHSKGWEKRWVTDPKKTVSKFSNNSLSSWLTACFEETPLNDTNSDIVPVSLSSDVVPLIAMGACVYGLPSSFFLAPDSEIEKPTGSFFSASNFAPASKAYKSDGNERMVSLKLDTDGRDIMQPVSAIKVRLGALVVCPQVEVVSHLISGLIGPYTGAIKGHKMQSEKSTEPATTSEEDVKDEVSSKPSHKSKRASLANWIEATPELRLRFHWTGLAVVVASGAAPDPAMRHSLYELSPSALVLSVSRIKASLNSVSKKGDMQVLASVGSLDLLVDGALPFKFMRSSLPSVPLGQSIISVREYLEPKKQGAFKSIHTSSEPQFLAVQVVSRSHSVNKEFAKHGGKLQDESALGPAVDAESSLLLEGPWALKVSAKVSRLSFCLSPILAPTLLGFAETLVPEFLKIKSALDNVKNSLKDDTNEASKTKPATKSKAPPSKASSTFSIPKLNVRVDLPEIIIPISSVDLNAPAKLKPVHMRSLNVRYAKSLQAGLTRAIKVQLGSLVITDGYSTSTTMNPEVLPESAASISKQQFDLHIMAILKDINIGLCYLTCSMQQKEEHRILYSLLPLSNSDFPFASDYCVMDSLLIQQAPIMLHITKKQFFGQPDFPLPASWETLPQTVLDSMKIRVEGQIEPLRIRVSDHVIRQLTLLVPQTLLPIYEYCMSQIPLVTVPFKPHHIDNSSMEELPKTKPVPKPSSSTPVIPEPVFVSLRLKLLAVEVFQSFYGPNLSDSSASFQDPMLRPVCLTKTATISIADIHAIVARFEGAMQTREQVSSFKESLINLDANVGAISVMLAAHPNTSQVAGSICSMQSKWIGQNQAASTTVGDSAQSSGAGKRAAQTPTSNNVPQSALVNWSPYTAPGQVEGYNPEFEISSTWLLRSLILCPPVVQLLGPRTLLYSTEATHEKPTTPLIKVHALISKAFTRSDFVQQDLDEFSVDDDLPVPLLVPEPSSSAAVPAPVNEIPFTWSCHSETQITIETDELRATANVEALDNLLQSVHKGIIPSVLQLQSSAKPSAKEPAKPSEGKKSGSKSLKADGADTSPKMQTSSHVRALVKLAPISVQLPATSRLSSENPVEVPPRGVVPSLIVELALDAEVSMLNSAHKMRQGITKPSIKASALLHSLQIYRSAYGQASGGGSSSASSLSHRLNILGPSMLKGKSLAKPSEAKPSSKKKTSIDAILQSPAIKDATPASHVSTQRKSTYSHSVGKVGRLFTEITHPDPSMISESQKADLQDQSHWLVAGKLGWRHAGADSGAPQSSSRISILDPSSISISATVLPSGSMDASIVATPLYIKVSNRDALASMAVVQSVLDGSILSTVKAISTDMATQKAKPTEPTSQPEKSQNKEAQVVGHVSRMVKLSLGGLRILVLEEGSRAGLEVPVVNVQLDTVLAEAHIRSFLVLPESPVSSKFSVNRTWKEEIAASMSLELRAGYFDMRGSFWETLIDPWRIDAHFDKSTTKLVVPHGDMKDVIMDHLPLSRQRFQIVPGSEQPSVIDVWARSEQRIEVTVTSELLKLLQRTATKWKLAEWRLALESYSSRQSSSSRTSERKPYSASLNPSQKMSSLAASAAGSQDGETSSLSSSSYLLSGGLFKRGFDGRMTPHSLLSSMTGSVSNSALRTPGGLSRSSIAPPHQAILINKTGLPLSYALPPTSFNGPLGNPLAHVLAIDSQTTLPSESLIFSDFSSPNAPPTIASLAIQFGAYNPIYGIPILERSTPQAGAVGSTAYAGHLAPVSGTRFFQVTRSLTRDSDAASSAPSSSNEGITADVSDSHILVIEYTTIDLITFITVKGTALFVNDCKTKNVRVGHSNLKSIREHHLLPAGATWPIPFQWLDEGILNELLYAHHLSRVERAIHKTRANLDPESRAILDDAHLSHVTTPPAPKSQLSIDFQTLDQKMLVDMLTSKGAMERTSQRSGSSSPVNRRGMDLSSSSSNIASSAIRPPFSLSVKYQTRGDEHLKPIFPSSTHVPSPSGHKASLSVRELEQMSRMLPDFGASSLPLAIHVRPSLVFENLLPVSIDIRVLDRDTAKTIVQENGVPMGKQVEVFHDRMDHALLLSIRFSGSSSWTDDVLVNTCKAANSWQGSTKANKRRSTGPRQLVHADVENGDEKLADSILVRDDSDPSRTAKTHVLLEYKRPQLQTLHLALFASFWIENKTGLPLEFAFIDDPASIRPPAALQPSQSSSGIFSSSEMDSTLPADTTVDGLSPTGISNATPSINALLPHQAALRHLGGVNNVYPPSMSASTTNDDLCTIIDQTRVMPLFASFPYPASSSLSFFIHWIRKPPMAPNRPEPLTPQEDLGGFNRHWSTAIDFSSFLHSHPKYSSLDLSTPIPMRIPFSGSLSIQLALSIERCTGPFSKSFKINVVPHLFISNVSSPMVNSRFFFFSTQEGAKGSDEPPQGSTIGNPEKEVSVTLKSADPNDAVPAMPLYLLPFKDPKFNDLGVAFQLWRDFEEPLSVQPIALSSPQSKLVNMVSTQGDNHHIAGMARIELTRVEAVPGSGVLSSYLLAIATSSSFFSAPQDVDFGDLGGATLPGNVPKLLGNSVAFELSPYWISNNTAFWMKVTQSEDSRLKKTKKMPNSNLSPLAPASLVIAPNSAVPFTWDYPDMNHQMDVLLWNETSAPTASSSNNWIPFVSNLELDSTLLQMPIHLSGAIGTTNLRIKEKNLGDVPGLLSSGNWTKTPNQLVGVQVAVDGPRRHLKMFDLSQTPFMSLEQVSFTSSSPSPASPGVESKNSGTLNVKLYLGGLGLSVVHSKKRILSHLQSHQLFNTTSSIEDSAELMYFAIAGIRLNLNKSQNTKIEARVDALQLDCPDHSKLNTPYPVIITTMLDDVSDSNTGSTDFQANQRISPFAISLDLNMPSTPNPKKNEVQTPGQAPSAASGPSFVKIDFLSVSIRPLTISLDQSFIEIMLNFVSDSIIIAPSTQATSVATKLPVATSLQDGQTLSNHHGYASQLNASQITHGITSSVPAILASKVVSSSTSAMASSDSKRLISSGLALFKQPLWIGALVIAPVVLKLTITTSTSQSGVERAQSGYDSSRLSVFDLLNVNRFIRAFGAGAGGIDGLKLRFGAVGISRILVTPKELNRMIAKTYGPKAAVQALKLLGTLKFAGSLWLMAENIGEGFSDLVVDPLRVESDHGGYFTGAVHGAQNLLIKSLVGVSTSTSNASGSLANFLSELTESSAASSMPATPRTDASITGSQTWSGDVYGATCGSDSDEDDLLTGELNEQPKGSNSARGSTRAGETRSAYRVSYGQDGTPSTSEGILASSFVNLGRSILGGTVGLVRDPIVGWQQSGPMGAVSGLASGLAGVALKPTRAIAQLIHDSAAHLRVSAQRPPPSLLRAPRIPLPQTELLPSQASATSAFLNPNAGNGFAASSSFNSEQNGLQLPLLSTEHRLAGSSHQPNRLATSTVTSSILNYLLRSSTAFYSRRWDCYDGQRSIGQYLLTKVARERYNAELTYQSHYGSVSMMGSYVSHWFLPASASTTNATSSDTYWILTTRCFIKVVPPGSGVPFDSSLDRIGQIALLLSSPLDIRYILLLSNISSVTFDKPRRGSIESADALSSIPSNTLFINLHRSVSSSIDTDNSAIEEEDDASSKSYRKVKLASTDDANHLASLLTPR